MPASVLRSEEGAALIEAALVLPILLLLVLGLTDISLYLWNASLTEKAVQLGLRTAVVSDPVAIGPGLDPSDNVDFWRARPPGASCFGTRAEEAPCPSVEVTCGGTGCRCGRSLCGYRMSDDRLQPILAAMRNVLPEIAAQNVEIAYTTNGFGYVGRPGPMPVDVRLTLTGLSYRPLFLGSLLGEAVSLTATARRPGEALRSRS